MRGKMGQILDKWDPTSGSQLDALFSSNSDNLNAREAYAEYRPSWLLMSELKRAIDMEMQSVWHNYTDDFEQRDLELGLKPNRGADPHVIDYSLMAPKAADGSEEDQDKVVVDSLQRKFDPQQEPGRELGGDDMDAAAREREAAYYQVLGYEEQERKGAVAKLAAADAAAAGAGINAGTGRERRPLIVCASLVDKMPNLAGLCRTCEVFNAEALVVANKDRLLKDSQFTSVSVTAEQWLPLWDVAPEVEEIATFLKTQKKRGYAVVAVEQTHGSVCLSQDPFSKVQQAHNMKVVLLLGAEKEGLPAPLLSLCDQYVEIPQAGMIRSLNVHVSGALVVFEYIRALLCSSEN